MIGSGKKDRFAAAWWSASLGARSTFGLLDRWRATPLVWAGAGLAVSGCAEMLEQAPVNDEPSALDQQEQQGWNVGGEGRPLVFAGAQQNDMTGTPAWRDAMSTLAPRLTPVGERWAPYANPALFQSIESLRNADLRAAIWPIYTPEMALAYRRGQALLPLLTENGACRNDVAVVLDLPGPQAVAVAAALANCLDPVFIFGNWPHPLGVVPAHLTLAAALYFLPAFDHGRPLRSANNAPVFVLDRQRLAPYTDEAGLFDNRYQVGLPAPDELKDAGILHVLYVTPDERVTMDSDDVNPDLVAANEAGVDVKLLALSDFSERPLPDWPVPPPDGDDGCGPPAPLAAAAGAGPGAAALYFGGSPATQRCFTFWYGWRSSSGPLRHPVAAPARLLPRCHFQPSPRASLAVAGGSPGHGWHAHGGVLAGAHASGFFGRSGSMGRFHDGGGFG
jgi:hypothetical protein